MTDKRENVLPDYRIILLVAFAFFIFYLLLPIMTPFLIAAIVAYICSPLADKLETIQIGKFKIGRTIATIIIMALLVGVITLILLIIVPLMQKELFLVAERIPVYFSTFKQRVDPWLIQHFGVSLAIDSAQIQAIITKNWKSAGDFATQFLRVLSDHGLALVAWLANLLIIPLVFFYLLRDWHGLVDRVEQLLPRRWHSKTTNIASEVDLVLGEFLRGQLAVMLLMSAFYSIGLWMAGLELALPIGLLAGLLGFVPYLGIGTGMLLALLASALQFTSIGQFIPVAIVFGLGQVLESMFLTPQLVGERIGLHPVVVIFALLAGGELFGFTGILLALPVSAAIAVGLRHAKTSYLASQLYLKK
ncbi:AI-2E family transporter [Methylovorus sp. MM2]|uniref:AI-2E family transporter n=1 Tax=Methylovorus sp. MM2 TaxID=1848038 RepID=UPI0007E179BC|nr:AI-2E family transporter [Methylovorus sp. MM2]OAM51771.1 AI-2E family transporter [Methylovorus sp. MM2]